MPRPNIKESLRQLVNQLPEDATWNDVQHEAYVRQEIEAGIAEADKAEFADSDDVKAAFARWGVQVETEVD